MDGIFIFNYNYELLPNTERKSHTMVQNRAIVLKCAKKNCSCETFVTIVAKCLVTLVKRLHYAHHNFFFKAQSALAGSFDCHPIDRDLVA